MSNRRPKFSETRSNAKRSSVSTCPTGKRQFRSAAAARKFVRENCWAGNDMALPRFPYKCSKCGTWHLSRSAPRKVA